MLSSISWQQYLAAVAIITVSYYLYVILRYYQKEIANVFNRKQDVTTLLSHSQSPAFDVMGEAKPDNGVSITEDQQLQFAGPDDDDMEIHSAQNGSAAILVDTADDPSQELIAEAGELIEAFKEIDNKPEFVSLLNILIGSYKRFSSDIDLPDVLHRIVELSKQKLQFSIALADLQGTWE